MCLGVFALIFQVTCLFLRLFGKPAFADTLALLKEFENAPEAGETEYAQHNGIAAKNANT